MRALWLTALCLGCTTRAPIGQPGPDAAIDVDVGVVDAEPPPPDAAPTPCASPCALQAREKLSDCALPGCEAAVVTDTRGCLAEACPPPDDAPCEARCQHEGAQLALACALVPHVPGRCAEAGDIHTARCAADCAPSCEQACEREQVALIDLCEADGACAGAEVQSTCLDLRCGPGLDCEQSCDQLVQMLQQACLDEGTPAEACLEQTEQARLECLQTCPDRCFDGCAELAHALAWRCALANTDCAPLEACFNTGCLCGARCAALAETQQRACEVRFNPEDCQHEATWDEATCRRACGDDPCTAGCLSAARTAYTQCRTANTHRACAVERDQRFITCLRRTCPE